MLFNRFTSRFIAGATTLLASCCLGLLITGCSMPIKEQPATNLSTIEATPKDPCLIYDDELHEFTVPQPAQIWPRMRAGFGIDDNAAGNGSQRIAKRLAWYEKHPKHIGAVTLRGELYLHFILEKLDEKNLPYELALIPMAESGFDPFAYSHATASGLWQFMPRTGKYLGLEQNWWYDGRRDVTASTEAALNYLVSLNKQFDGDWLLTLAAYNGGPGNVRKAIKKNRKKGKPTDYWSLKLPKETEYYIPKILALKEVLLRPDIHNVTLPPIADAPYFALAQIDGQLDLAQAAKLANVDIDEIYQLNPGFNQWATAPDGPHCLVVPATKYDNFIDALQELPNSERVTWERYTIKQGDALISIAKKYRTNPELLKEINNLKNNNIRAGKTLLVPRASQENHFYILSSAQRQKAKQTRGKGVRMEYTVKSGDSLWTIARQYNTSTSQLARWNNIAARNTLRIGQKIVIWDKNSNANNTRKISYTVRNGDSLARIANKYSVSIRELEQWNSLNRTEILKLGKKLVIHVNVVRG